MHYESVHNTMVMSEVYEKLVPFKYSHLSPLGWWRPSLSPAQLSLTGSMPDLSGFVYANTFVSKILWVGVKKHPVSPTGTPVWIALCRQESISY